MTQYADYGYYISEYKGNMPETDFDRMSKIASAKITPVVTYEKVNNICFIFSSIVLLTFLFKFHCFHC